MILNIFVLTLLLFFVVNIAGGLQQIKTSKVMEIQFEIEQHYQHRIKTVYSTYQSASLSKFKNVQNNQSIKLCQVRLLQKGQFQTFFEKFHYLADDGDRRYDEKNVYYLFEDILNYKTFLDMTIIGSTIITIFENRQAIYYDININHQKSIVKQKYRSKLPTQQNITYVKFIKGKGNDVCLLITEQKAYRFYLNGSIIQLGNLEPMGYSFQTAKLHGENIFIAARHKIFMYRFNQKTNQLINIIHMYPKVIDQDGDMIQLQISQIQYDQTTQIIYVIDDYQGLKYVPLPKFQHQPQAIQNLIFLHTSIYNQNCQNLHLQNNQIFMTCPQVLILDKLTKQKKQSPSLNFYPNQMILNSSRIILVGSHEFAIYDLGGKKVEEGNFNYPISKGQIYQQFFIFSNDYRVILGNLQVDQEELYCTGKGKQAGVLNGTLSIQGNCEQYLLNQQSQIGNCIATFPITITITDVQTYWYILQVIGVLFILNFICAGCILYCVKDIKVRRDYNQLQEEATDSLQAKQSQEVLSEQSQRKDSDKSN